jgi:hypothetical protein
VNNLNRLAAISKENEYAPVRQPPQESQKVAQQAFAQQQPATGKHLSIWKRVA